MATNVSSIGTGKTYTTIAAWESDVQGDLVSAGDIEKGECYDQQFAENVTIDGSTTDASNYMWLTVAAGEEHDGTAGTGARNVPTAGGHAFTISDPFTRVEGLGISHGNPNNSDEGCRVTADNCIFRKLLIYDFGFSDGDGIYWSTSLTQTIENCIIYNCDRAGIHVQANSTSLTITMNVRNCTIMHCGAAGENESGAINLKVNGAGNTLTATINLDNTIAMHTESTFDDLALFNDGGAGTFADTWTINNSIVSDTSITGRIDSGSNNLESRTETENAAPGAGDWVVFVDITATTENYKLQDVAENDAVTNGIFLAAFTDDIIGNTRPGSTPWDIGAHEVTAASGYTPGAQLDASEAMFLGTGGMIGSRII